MPHDSKGKKIGQGDYISAKAWYKGGKLDIFKVVGINEGTDTCNVNAVPFESQINCSSFNAKEVELVLKADGSAPKEE